MRMRRALIHGNGAKSRWKCQGFTLLELILVMVLLTGVMAVVAPSLTGFFRSAALDEEGRRLVSVIEMTRREAIASGFATQVWFDSDRGLYGMRELQGVQADVLPALDEKKAAGKAHLPDAFKPGDGTGQYLSFCLHHRQYYIPSGRTFRRE